MTTIDIETKLCSQCVHAAFDDSGVWCKQFNEHEYNERVAQTCGAFEPTEQSPEILDMTPKAMQHAQSFLKQWEAAEAEPVEFVPAHLPMLPALPVTDDVEQGRLQYLTERYEQYLGTLHSTLWGKSFNIFSEEGRRACAEWLAEANVEAMKGEE